MASFAEKLKEQEDRIDCNHMEACKILGGMPRSTYMSWLDGSRVPAKHVQEVFLFRLRAEPTRRPQPRLKG